MRIGLAALWAAVDHHRTQPAVPDPGAVRVRYKGPQRLDNRLLVLNPATFEHRPEDGPVLVYEQANLLLLTRLRLDMLLRPAPAA